MKTYLFFKKPFWRSHWYLDFWWCFLWAASFVLGEGIYITCSLRFAAGVVSADLLAASMAAKLFSSVEFFPKWSVTLTEFSEFRETDNHWGMNWAQFKGPVSHMCCVGAVVACWSLTQEVAGWQGFESFYWMTYFCHWIQWQKFTNI